MKKLLVSLGSKLRPNFWDHFDVSPSRLTEVYNFRRVWELTIVLTLSVAVIPLIVMAIFDHNLTEKSFEREISLRSTRVVSNIWPTVTFFLAERKSALFFTVQEHSFEELSDRENLNHVLVNLKNAFGGFTDLGVIESSGLQRTYAGPYDLEGQDYSNEDWFKEVIHQGVYISDVFLGFRNVPHIVIATRHALAHNTESEEFYVLRTTLDMEKFNNLLSQLEFSGQGDIFIVNHDGVLQTPSRYYGRVFDKLSFEMPAYSAIPQLIERKNAKGEQVLLAYAYIEQTPFVLVLMKNKSELMKPWVETRVFLYVFLAISITIITIVVLSVTTYLVSKIYTEEQKKVQILHHVEYSNKLASLGRLAAGVAHEVNNPLAVINEKAGLIKDLFTFTETYKDDTKLMGAIDLIIDSVERCARITRRLLRFARHMDIKIGEIDLKELISEVLGFLNKEAEYRSIDIEVNVHDNASRITSDQGKLQQIFLNIINNALGAIDDGGSLAILVKKKNESEVEISIQDDGCGISPDDLNKIFEPFYSTKTKDGGTGLGLSITYGLVKELGGSIYVSSAVNVGTTFTITLPYTLEKKEREKTCEHYL